MPSINGIALKAIKTLNTMDGLAFTSNVYLDSKKIGTAEDGGYGGEVEIYIEPKYREEFGKRIKDYYEANPAKFEGETWMISEIFKLWEAERFFKKNVKKGFPILVNLTYRTRTEDLSIDKPYKPDQLMACRNEEIAMDIIEKYKPADYTFYRKAEDFNIITMTKPEKNCYKKNRNDNKKQESRNENGNNNSKQ